MSGEKLENFHLLLIQDVLPVGVAIVQRAQKGGVKEVLDVFGSDKDAIDKLKQEGEPSSIFVRDTLEKFSPGLGYPVISVDIKTEEIREKDTELDNESLQIILNEIEQRIDKLCHYFEDETCNKEDLLKIES